MDRRDFMESCTKSAACLGAAALPSTMAWAANAKPRDYAKAVLCSAQGEPVKASSLRANTNYVFHYPFEATPVFLLNLDKAALPKSLNTKSNESYDWPGGVGANRSIVAFSAICAHHLVYPTPQVSFISFRKSKSSKGVQDNLIHCCAEHSQYDPAQGAQVLSGPAPQPLCAVLLQHDAKTDTLTAYATLGGEMFDEFFKKYEAKLSLDIGTKAKNKIVAKATVQELDKFCRNPVQC
jgi:arsenite oxidase small subunit